MKKILTILTFICISSFLSIQAAELELGKWNFVLDDDYSQGVATNLAYEIMKKTGKKVDVMGLKDKSAGFSKETDNLPPNCSEIVKKVKEIIK